MIHLKALCEVENEDWKTAQARNQQPIPKNAIVTYLGTYNNYYGTFLEVQYNNEHYYVDKRLFEKISEDNIYENN